MPEQNPHSGPENDLDPGANTQMFQAFVDRHEPEEARAPKPWAAVVGIAVLMLVIVVALAWLVFG